MTADATPTQLLVQSTLSHAMKVESRDGDAIGSVYAFMVHKGSGRTTHAVLSLGGIVAMEMLRHYRQHGDKARALHHAIRRLRRDSGLPGADRPEIWAPFVLID